MPDPARDPFSQLLQRQNLSLPQVAARTQAPQQPDRLKAVLDEVAKNILGISLTEAENMSPDDKIRLGITQDKINQIYRLGGSIAEKGQ